VEELLEAGLLKDPLGIFGLEARDGEAKEGERLEDRERWGKKSVLNLFASIRERRRIPLARFIYALGIPHVGLITARDIAQHFGSVEAWWTAMLALRHNGTDTAAAPGASPLGTIDGIGGVIIEALSAFVRDDRNRQLVESLLGEVEAVGSLSPVTESTEGAASSTPRGEGAAEGSALQGKNILFTGAIRGMSRSEAEDAARGLGAVPCKTISKKVDVVVVGAEPGGKAKKAAALGVKCISEDEWLTLVGRRQE
jgi:DNA ligase (NAD+)